MELINPRLIFGANAVLAAAGAFEVIRWARKALTHVRVRDPNAATGWSAWPVARLTDGRRLAVWAVWDWQAGGLGGFLKKEWGAEGKPVEATLEEFNEYRRAMGESEFTAKEVVAFNLEAARERLPVRLADREFERLVDEALIGLEHEFRTTARRFWSRTVPLTVGAVTAVALVAAAVAGMVLGRPFSWSAVATIALALLTAVLLFVEVPRRPRRSDAALEVVVRSLPARLPDEGQGFVRDADG